MALGGPLGAILGHLGRSDRSRNAPSRSRGGGRGRGKPLPEGEEGGWKKGRGCELNHPRPEGLVGFVPPQQRAAGPCCNVPSPLSSASTSTPNKFEQTIAKRLDTWGLAGNVTGPLVERWGECLATLKKFKPAWQRSLLKTMAGGWTTSHRMHVCGPVSFL